MAATIAERVLKVLRLNQIERLSAFEEQLEKTEPYDAKELAYSSLQKALRTALNFVKTYATRGEEV